MMFLLVATLGLSGSVLSQQAQSQQGGGISTAGSGAAGGSASGDSRNTVDAETRELRVGDSVRYRIDEDPHASSDSLRAQVNAAGDLHLMVSRRKDTYITVPARGRRLADVRRDFKQKLDADYYHDATISVDLDNIDRTGNLNASAARVIFYGEVRGTIPLPDDREMMLSEAILQLPSSQFADLKRVEVQRVDPVTQETSSKQVNVQDILDKNRRDEDIPMRDGDRVRVPAKRFNF